jgi:RNA polymerase sigma-70 factor (TIGR02943 family)
MSVEMQHHAIDPERWVEQYGDQLYRYALIRLRSPQLAEEKVQEALLAAIQARLDYRGRAFERTWLTGILRHKICDHFRKVKRERRFNGMVRQEGSTDHLFHQDGRWIVGPSEWTFDPRHALERKEFLHTFHCCLSELPPRLAQAFSLREIDGMSTGEICKVMAVSAANLSVMLHRSRMRLRYCLEKRWFSENACQPEIGTEGFAVEGP